MEYAIAISTNGVLERLKNNDAMRGIFQNIEASRYTKMMGNVINAVLSIEHPNEEFKQIIHKAHGNILITEEMFKVFIAELTYVCSLNGMDENLIETICKRLTNVYKKDIVTAERIHHTEKMIATLQYELRSLKKAT